MFGHNKKPHISVLMPLYNCEQFVEKAIYSILSQSYSDFELLIVDDGSDDKSWEKVNRINDSRITKYKFDKNMGNVYAVNFLLEKANGDYITFQDADDWSDESRLMLQKDVLSKYEDIHLCGTGYNSVGVDGSIINQISFPQNLNGIREFIELNKIPPVCCATMMFRKIVLQEIGLFRQYFDRLGAADFDWYLRVIDKFNVYNLQDYLYFYRRNLYSITKTMTMDPRKIHSEKIAFFLYNQRQIQGFDSLESGSIEEIDFFLIPFIQPYLMDRTLIYREIALHNMNKGFYCSALKIILLSISVEPLKKYNWSHLKFFIWKFFNDRTINFDNI